jgi:mRNA interferase RelE/StbE
MAPARRLFDRVPISLAAAVLETLQAIAENPRRLGKPLMLEHEGRFSARRGPYRIIYELVEDERIVRVVVIGHRRDVYRPRSQQLRRVPQ